MQVNVLSAEVYTDGHMLMPVPTAVSELPAFQAVFPGRARNCTPVSVASTRRVYELEDRRRGFLFTLHHWEGLDEAGIRPPVPTDTVAVAAAVAAAVPLPGLAMPDGAGAGAGAGADRAVAVLAGGGDDGEGHQARAPGLFDSDSDDGVPPDEFDVGAAFAPSLATAAAALKCYGMPVELRGGAVRYAGVICPIKLVDGVACGWVGEVLASDVHLARYVRMCGGGGAVGGVGGGRLCTGTLAVWGHLP